MIIHKHIYFRNNILMIQTRLLFMWDTFRTSSFGYCRTKDLFIFDTFLIVYLYTYTLPRANTYKHLENYFQT